MMVSPEPLPGAVTRRRLLLGGAVFVFGLALTASRPLALVLIASGALLSILALSPGSGQHSSLRRFELLMILGIGVFGTLSLAGPAFDVIGDPPSALFPVSGAVWIGLGFAWLRLGNHGTGRRVIYGLVLVATTVIGALHITAASGVGFDVWLLHQSAAEAIGNGLSPYSEAVTVPNGAPVGAEFIVGYPYPPLTVIAYSAGSWLGDPRWTSLAAWVLALALIGRRSWATDGTAIPLGVMLLAASVPGWPRILTGAWTEPVSLAVFALVTVAWALPTAWGLCLGILMGSKQYLLALAPLLGARGLGDRWRRLGWSVAGLVLSLIPLVLWGIGGVVDATVGFHLEAPARPDGTSLVGFLGLAGVEWIPPAWLTLLVVLAAGLMVARFAVTPARWAIGAAIVLIAAFLVSSQAFANYWFMVMGILAIAATADDGAARTAPDRSEPVDTLT